MTDVQPDRINWSVTDHAKFCKHEWRLVHEAFVRDPERVPNGTTRRRWYCVHCRTFETTVHAPAISCTSPSSARSPRSPRDRRRLHRPADLLHPLLDRVPLGAQQCRWGLLMRTTAENAVDARGAATAHALRVASEFPHGSAEHFTALYHDYLEDGLDLPLHVSGPVCLHVFALTRRKDERYRDYIERLRTSGDDVAIAVKRADLRDNIARCRGEYGGTVNPGLARRYTDALARLHSSTVERAS